jgi:hypothetical protein
MDEDEVMSTGPDGRGTDHAMEQQQPLAPQTSASGARAGLPGRVWIIAAALVAVLLLWLIVL